MNNYIAELTPQEVVDTFPEGKKTVSRLIKGHEKVLEQIQKARADVKQTLSENGVSMFDIDFATDLIMTLFGPAEEDARKHIARLTRLLYLYDPPKKLKAGVTDADIAHAKATPIGNLIAIKRGKAKCLWHDDKNPSLHIYKDHVYCFVCNKHADAIDIYMVLNNCDFVTAVKALI